MDLSEYVIRQGGAEERQATLLRMVRLGKSFVVGLEPAKIVLIHRFSGLLIGAEHDADRTLHWNKAKEVETKQLARKTIGIDAARGASASLTMKESPLL